MEATPAAATKNNVQIVQQGFTDFLKGNIAAIQDACTEDTQWGTYKVPNVPYSGSFYGKEGVQEYFTQVAKSLNFNSFEPKEFVAQGDWVLVLGHNSGTVKATGKSFENDWCFSFKLRDSKIAEFFAFVDSYDAFTNFQP